MNIKMFKQSKRFFAVFLPCFAMVVCLIIATSTQGPKLSQAAYTHKASSTSWSRLRIVLNQPIEELSSNQVKLSVRSGYKVTTKGNIVTIRFFGNLPTGEKINISLCDVKSKNGNVTAKISYSFSTPEYMFD